jgi:O-antigen/teichoic acid export membrane protein
MSRLRRAIHSVTSGYVSLVAASLYSLASVPVALHYLSNRRFLLWALMSSIAGYLSLIDLGMSSSLARLLVDHKDQRQQGSYGSMIKTGMLVLVAQGAIIWLVGFALAPVFGWLADIPADLRAEFIALMRWQTTTLAVAFPIRIFSQLLQAHQRADIVNYSQVGTLASGFGLQWFFLDRGHGVFSLAWGSLLGALIGAVFLGTACWKLGLFPAAGEWGRARWQQFQEIFSFGRDLFLAALGTQLIMGSQTIIITRALGPEMGTLWYVGTRVFNLLNQVIWRIYDASSWAFAEMMARGEKDLLQQRYKTVVMLTGSLSGLFAVAYVLCNSLFVPLWTHGKAHWPPFDDALLGLWMVQLALLHAHNGFAALTKRVGFMRYIYFAEGLVLVTSALLTSRWGGLPAVILCSVVCSAVFSGPYGIWRVSRYFNISFADVAFRWQKPMAKMLLVLLPFAVLAGWMSSQVQAPVTHLAANLCVSAALGGYVLLRYGTPGALKEELIGRAPARLSAILRRLLGSPQSLYSA